MGRLASVLTLTSGTLAELPWARLAIVASAFAYVALPAQALAQDDGFARDAGVFSSWFPKVESIVSQLYEVLDQVAELDEISSSLVEGEISDIFARRTGQRIQDKAKFTYEQVSAEIDCCLFQPDLKTEILVRSAHFAVQYLRQMKEQVLGSIDDSRGTFAAALEGDATVVEQLQARQLERWVLLLESENVYIATQKLLVEDTHPQFALSAALMSGNSALIALVNSWSDYLRDTADMADVSTIHTERELLRMMQAINDGEKAVLDWSVTIGGLRSERASNDGMVDILQRMMDSYTTSFNIEKEIAAVIRSLAESSTNTAPARDDFIEAEMLALELVIDRRMQLQSERIQLVGEMSEFMR